MTVAPVTQLGPERDRRGGLTFSAPVLEKGERLHMTGKVREVTVTRAFIVEGDTGTYAVIVHTDGSVSCTCPHRGAGCSHIAAVGHYMRAAA